MQTSAASLGTADIARPRAATPFAATLPAKRY
ncbi:hypothetical protein HDF11_004473 [Tunturiibacter psychrotolerans]